MPARRPQEPAGAYVSELASRLLFLTLQWLRNVPAFRPLGPGPQASLAKACWAELVILGLAQVSPSVRLNSVLSEAARDIGKQQQEGERQGDATKLPPHRASRG
eukprot:gi/632992003/ref/XP_007884880.1/ PREDICTED: nuclear receptor subfamily 2 group C member 2-like [Callorhinchus milii]